MAGGSTPTALGAPCAAGLTVAGVPLTGSDCIVASGGSIQITEPRLLTNGAVRISGRMILDAARSELVPENPIPQLITVGIRQAVAGRPRVASLRCDLQPPPTEIPLILALDDQRGGRVFGTVGAQIPKGQFAPNVPPSRQGVLRRADDRPRAGPVLGLRRDPPRPDSALGPLLVQSRSRSSTRRRRPPKATWP